MNAVILHSNGEWGSKELSTSRFDRCFGWLITVLMFATITVASLFVCWLYSDSANNNGQDIYPEIGISPIDMSDGPPADFLPVLTNDQTASLAGELSESIAFPDWENLLEAVSKATEIVGATMPDVTFVSGADPRRLGRRGIGTEGEGGLGIGEIPGGISLARRWQIEYSARSLSEYRVQLEQLGVVIGVVRQNDNEVIRVRPTLSGYEVKQSDRFRESRVLFFGHQRPFLEAWERRLVEEAGVLTANSLIVQFVDRELRDELLARETAFATSRGKRTDQIQHTVFGVAVEGGRANYVVREQTYR